jgi:hypothetical protein
MNEDILQRAMFAMPLSPEAQNSGIMSGFMDEGAMDGEEPVPQEDMDLEEMPVMARTPQNPEILMNNLRGDMRSLDARYVELAQMVGEQAAMDTPPEVLAMLMGQAGAQEQQAAAAPAGAPGAPGPEAAGAGIGALPQAQEMAPPGMMPPDMGMQAPPPEMMPQGMGDMGPFPSGGAEQAPPQQFAVGGLVAGARLAGPALARGAQQLNQYLGSKFMAPQFTTQAVRGPGGQQLVGQARESLRMLPGGQIAQGAGTQLAPMSTLGQMASPTFTQGIRQGLAPVLGSTTGQLATGLGAGSLTAAGMLNAFGPDQQMSEEDILAAQSAMRADTSGIPGEEPLYTPAVRTEEPEALPPEGAPAAAPVPVTERAPEASADDTTSFIDRVTTEAKKRTRAERVRESYDELSPLYKEILGDDADTRKQQALLLLAEAGFKFAGSTKPTMGMALGEALSGIPAGMSTLAAQKAEREAKLKAAALSQAVEGVADEDKAARALQLEALKGANRILVEQAKNSGGKVTDGGVGLRVAEDGRGNFMGFSIDPNDPTVKRALTSRFTLNRDNPFVVDVGPVPQSYETDKGERIKLGVALRNLDNALVAVEQGKSELAGTQGPGAYISNFSNVVFSPVLPVAPNIEAQKRFSTINPILNRIAAGIANAQQTGRVAVQEMEWIREDMPSRAARFWKDPEIGATEWSALHAQLLNARQNVVSQLYDVPSELVMKVPATGTKNDPFVLPADEQGRANMVSFLSREFGKVTDPKARVYLRMPDGRVAPYNINTLRSELGAQ